MKWAIPFIMLVHTASAFTLPLWTNLPSLYTNLIGRELVEEVWLRDRWYGDTNWWHTNNCLIGGVDYTVTNTLGDYCYEPVTGAVPFTATAANRVTARLETVLPSYVMPWFTRPPDYCLNTWFSNGLSRIPGVNNKAEIFTKFPVAGQVDSASTNIYGEIDGTARWITWANRYGGTTAYESSNGVWAPNLFPEQLTAHYIAMTNMHLAEWPHWCWTNSLIYTNTGILVTNWTEPPVTTNESWFETNAAPVPQTWKFWVNFTNVVNSNSVIGAADASVVATNDTPCAPGQSMTLTADGSFMETWQADCAEGLLTSASKWSVSGDRWETPLVVTCDWRSVVSDLAVTGLYTGTPHRVHLYQCYDYDTETNANKYWFRRGIYPEAFVTDETIVVPSIDPRTNSDYRIGWAITNSDHYLPATQLYKQATNAPYVYYSGEYDAGTGYYYNDILTNADWPVWFIWNGDSTATNMAVLLNSWQDLDSGEYWYVYEMTNYTYPYTPDPEEGRVYSYTNVSRVGWVAVLDDAVVDSVPPTEGYDFTTNGAVNADFGHLPATNRYEEAEVTNNIVMTWQTTNVPSHLVMTSTPSGAEPYTPDPVDPWAWDGDAFTAPSGTWWERPWIPVEEPDNQPIPSGGIASASLYSGTKLNSVKTNGISVKVLVEWQK